MNQVKAAMTSRNLVTSSRGELFRKDQAFSRNLEIGVVISMNEGAGLRD
jgi:hypothetical protein